jgi:hypothetical protein
MEEGYERIGLRVNRREVRFLDAVAVGAGEAEVEGIVAAAVLAGANVFDVEGEVARGGLGQAAILAALMGAPLHKLPKRCFASIASSTSSLEIGQTGNAASDSRTATASSCVIWRRWGETATA